MISVFSVAQLHFEGSISCPEVGMAQALEMLGFPLLGTHHRGDDDAWNIAAILAELLKKLRTE